MGPDDGTLTTLPAAPLASPRSRRLSDILTEIAADPSRERISIGDLLAVMHDRAFGAMMFVFAVPNVLPTPPGTSSILGAPLLFLSVQLMLGLKPWLPALIAGRSMPRRDFANLIARVAPWLARGERLLKPRLSRLARRPFDMAVGLVCLVLAVVLFLPIPLGNMAPAFAICLLSLGILERDGVWVLAGLVTAAAALLLAWGVVYALVKSAVFVLTNALGL